MMQQGRVVDLSSSLALRRLRLSIEHKLPMEDSVSGVRYIPNNSDGAAG